MPPAQVVEDDDPGEELTPSAPTVSPTLPDSVATVAATTKAEDEAADYDESAPTIQSPASQLTRSMPDYGDLIADADDFKLGSVKDSDAGSDAGSTVAAREKAPKRPEAILISGVERLNRGHLAEVFQAKDLPEFVRLDWIADSEVIAVFDSTEDAQKALSSALEGFRDVPDDGAPGPGLWRARRAMLDFRQATVADQPEFGFKRLHRAGKQVRDFRLWTALKDMDKQILEREEESMASRKRAAPEDAKEEEEGAPRKRQRRKDDDSIDMLEKMANQDRKLLVKQEEAGLLDPLPEAPPMKPEPGIEEMIEQMKADQAAEDERWRHESIWWSRENRGGWEHDDREDWEDDGGRWRSQFRQRWNDKGKGKGKGKSKGKDKGKGKKGKKKGPSGPNLERERITTEPVTGEVLEWKGKYGWIQPTIPPEHEKAVRHGGRLYISMTDLVGCEELTQGSLCQFHIFVDANGLGAEECIGG
mmetsp:Transcript_12071/g.22110  ORF Transcript_12071/g.22110 Transcript_12071/m.22110 type:complete len:475 (+) Transcript_12071:127-1551(+)